MGKGKTSCSSSSSESSISNKTSRRVGNLIKLLPTGTVFLFQFLNSVATNNGHCQTINKLFTTILIGVCGFSCAFSCFTDSYKGTDGIIHYGIATATGLSPPPSDTSVNLSSYKLRVRDFEHALFSVMVFAVVSLLDSNTVECFHPSFESTGKVLLMGLPPVIGTISGTLFMFFPNKRHGIGYPSNDDSK